MLDFSKAYIDKLIIHKIGSRSEDEGIQFSEQSVALDDEIIEQLLLTFFVSPFKDDLFRQFRHQNDINLNEMYTYASALFDDETLFVEQSKKMAEHLYEKSDHPNIRKGEFYTVIIKDCLIDDELADAIGVFKTENKDTYLKIKDAKGYFKPDCEQGINIKKLDKGALIFNTERANGFVLKMVDNINKTNEAHFWRDDFLNVKAREDNYFHTEEHLKICKNFADEALKDIEKKDRIALKNDTMQFFNSRDDFSIEDFEDEVIANEEMSERFRDYRASYAENHDISLVDSFDISAGAVKKAKSKFKSILKLDKNFHVYVHGNRNNIEKGYDEARKQNYYKLYFDEES